MVPFLLCAMVVLVARCAVLLADQTRQPRVWAWKALVEALAALALGLPWGVWSLLVIVTVLMNAIGSGVAHARGAAREGWHLVTGLLHLGLLSWLLRPELGGGTGVDLAMVRQALLQQTALAKLLAPLITVKGLTVAAGLVWLIAEANLLVRWVLGALNLKPTEVTKSVEYADDLARAEERQTIDRREYRRGRVIGVLERALIYGFVLSGQLAAVGFTLVAKGFTRHKAMDRTEFAEYVLIGTLLSSGLAMLAALAVGQMIH